MISAERAKEIVGNYNSVYSNPKKISEDLLALSRLGMSNHIFEVEYRNSGKITQELIDSGFKVFVSISPYKSLVEVTVEW